MTEAAGSSSGSPKRPLVSVCIPVYNGAEFIEEAVSSVLAQGYPALEVIVQDNASTDATWDIVRSLAGRHACISAERNRSNVGMAPNWNIAIDRARGDYAMLMSADDLMEPGFLDTCVNALESGEADLVSTNHYCLGRGGRKRLRRVRVKGGVYRHFYSRLLLSNPFPVVFSLFKRRTLEGLKAGGRLFDETYTLTCDYELLVRMSLSGVRLLYLEEPLATYRWHEANLSRQVPLMNRQAAEVLIRHRDELVAVCDTVYRLTMMRFILRLFRNALFFGSFDIRLFFALWRECLHVR